MGLFVEHDVPLKNHCTFGVGGAAKNLVKVKNMGELVAALNLPPPHLVLGAGSKVLISDKGFDGTVILMRDNSTSFGRGKVYAAAGTSLVWLSKAYADRGLAGLEWACGIPATVGGALKLNAGAHGGEMANITRFVDVFRCGKVVRLKGSECGFGYRTSGFLPLDIILGAEFDAPQGDPVLISATRLAFKQKRAKAQPAGKSCGSVFKAGELPAYHYILAAGLVGLKKGGAELSSKHANFILNTKNASAADIYALIQTIRARVEQTQNIRLKEEVIYIGDFD